MLIRSRKKLQKHIKKSCFQTINTLFLVIIEIFTKNIATMDEKELLKKAFEYGNIPSLITYCFTEPCPMKDKCSPELPAAFCPGTFCLAQWRKELF